MLGVLHDGVLESTEELKYDDMVSFKFYEIKLIRIEHKKSQDECVLLYENVQWRYTLYF